MSKIAKIVVRRPESKRGSGIKGLLEARVSLGFSFLGPMIVSSEPRGEDMTQEQDRAPAEGEVPSASDDADGSPVALG